MVVPLSPMPIYPPGPLGQTDPSLWRLDSSDSGRHVWHYIRSQDSSSNPGSSAGAGYEPVWGEDSARVREGPQTTEAKYWLGMDLPPAQKLPDPKGNPYEAARNGESACAMRGGRGRPRAVGLGLSAAEWSWREQWADGSLELGWAGYEFYKRLQSPDGHWSGEYGGQSPHSLLTLAARHRLMALSISSAGPMFLLPGMVITCYVTKTAIPEEWKIEMTRYLANMQRTGGDDDQGWGIHIEAKSSVFGTGLNYTAMRLLGVDAEASCLFGSLSLTAIYCMLIGPCTLQEPCMIRARATLHALGGCTGIPS